MSNSMNWYVNYTLEASLDPRDRGSAYGDGLFETFLVVSSQLQQCDQHFLRLARGCARLGIPWREEDQVFLTDFIHNLALSATQHHVVKVIVTRGIGGRGYLPPENVVPTVIVGHMQAPDYSDQQRHGVILGVSSVPCSTNPALAGVKHLNRLENVLAKMALKENEFEAVMLNTKSEVVEGIQSNVFWVRNGIVYTPLLDGAGVQGTMRNWVLGQLPQEIKCIGSYGVDELVSADEIFICNSLMGVVPIISFADRCFSIGCETRKLQRRLGISI